MSVELRVDIISVFKGCCMDGMDQSSRKPIFAVGKLQSWRQELIRRVFFSATAFGVVAMVVGFFATRLLWLRPFYIGLYLSFLLVTSLRWGSYRLRAWGCMGLLYGMSLLSLFEDGMHGDGRVFLLALPLLALLLLGERAGIVFLVLAVATMAVFGAAFSTGLIAIPPEEQVVVDNPIGWTSATLVFAAIGAVTVASLGYIVRRLIIALDHSHSLAQELDKQRASLESQVAGRTGALVQRTEELNKMVTTQQQLLDIMRQMSTPVVPLREGIIVMPLVGVIDSERAEQVTENLLGGVEEHRAQVAILDITGVPVVDTHVADYLLKAMRSAQLLGARSILVGLRPEIAHTIVSLGMDLSELVTRSTLQEGIEYALHHLASRDKVRGPRPVDREG